LIYPKRNIPVKEYIHVKLFLTKPAALILPSFFAKQNGARLRSLAYEHNFSLTAFDPCSDFACVSYSRVAVEISGRCVTPTPQARSKQPPLIPAQRANR
ncbi:MAG TPA: hypothetical protein VI703_01960, partial [Anaerolineales bacterium]|nr:hypothetical protein [Anaerolineales bacterium]